ncbi:hypothetical protein N7G274_008410 [Stereocaulon virgatum]|uniref:SAM-dependent MTase RsmB/NOP-type domain-containing protein n=1 Tax=Stereocaulon virgatum TaxID=373712 RepID=A0ABR4A6B6_9LECA
MSLYHDAAALLVPGSDQAGTLKSRVFNCKDLKSPPKQVYALLSEASRWSSVLSEVVEKSQLLQLERKLSPSLALLLVHDLLLNKRGISAPASHPLRTSVEKHKARLAAELTKARLKRGFISIEDLRVYVETGNIQTDHQGSASLSHNEDRAGVAARRWPHPRWVRVNTIKTSLDEQLRTTFAGYKHSSSLEQLLDVTTSRTEKLLHIDKHIPNLLALPPLTDVSKTPAYTNGLIIFQDKASCFPAYLLDVKPEDGNCMDACAAPGNKTTHLAAIADQRGVGGSKPQIYACERDKTRALTLQQMVRIAGAENHVTIKAGQDFLRMESSQPPSDGVGALLLDPSCSGSGIVGRDEVSEVILPRSELTYVPQSRSKKRKRKAPVEASQPIVETPVVPEETPLNGDDSSDRLSTRLAALSAFQLKLLLHAFEFPKARKITYSTCSVYLQENEHVVTKALESPIAKKRGWRILQRDQQISGMKAWEIRGNSQACREVSETGDVDQVAEACIRCEKGTKEGTQGFFVAAFIRDGKEQVPQKSLEEEEEEEDWGGFSDGSYSL